MPRQLLATLLSTAILLMLVSAVGSSKVTGTPPEITKIKASTNAVDKAYLYRQLIDRVGPEQAQEDLKNSGLPFDGESHLLNHIVGDWLYEKYGNSGLVYCKDYFLSSCYHGFLINVIGTSGLTDLDEVMASCWEKGNQVAPQCAHAIGHGLLAFEGYANLTQALKKCDEVVSLSQNFPSYNCYDGVFMENIWAIHQGVPSPDRWVKAGDMTYPCSDPRIEAKYLGGCWSNQPTLIYQYNQGDPRKSGEECLKVADENFKKICFDGLARQLHPVAGGSVDNVFNLCGQMPSGWAAPCIKTMVGAYFSVGDRELPFSICSRIEVPEQSSCYGQLSGMIKIYTGASQEERSRLCAKIPSQFSQNCSN